MPPTALYVCYQSVCEPLTQTQVVAYLEGLALAGYRMVLLTFEPRPLSEDEKEQCREKLLSRGIIWHSLRYHKAPTVPATAWDILAGTLAGLRLVHKYRVRLLHARGHVPGLMALALKSLTKAKFLFDVRGFMAEEYVDAGVWPSGGILFKAVKRVERLLVEAADAIVVLTEAASSELRRWYPAETSRKSVHVIPCCVDRRAVPDEQPDTRPTLLAPGGKTLAYAGKLGGWYPIREMLELLAALREMIPGLRLQVWTQTDPTAIERLAKKQGLDQYVQTARTAPDLLSRELARADAGLCLYRRPLSGVACSPTKVGEYLAAGLPVICSGGIGDMDSLLTGGRSDRAPVGVLVHGSSTRSFREAASQLADLLADPEAPMRCRTVARQTLDLEEVGWPRYRQVYQELFAAPGPSARR